MPNNSTKILLLTTLVGGILVSVSSNSWLGAWIGLEINLISFIPLISSVKNMYNTEASLKYFIGWAEKFAWKLDKTGSRQSRDSSRPPYVTLNPQISVTPVQYQSKWKAVRPCGSKNVPSLIYWLRKKIFPIVYHHRLQAGYGENVLMSGQLDVCYGSLSISKCGGGEQICFAKQGQGVQEGI